MVDAQPETSSWIVRERHPFDDGYWARYDGKKRPTGQQQRYGWDECNREFACESDSESKFRKPRTSNRTA